jgi:hypothetical protein
LKRSEQSASKESIGALERFLFLAPEPGAVEFGERGLDIGERRAMSLQWTGEARRLSRGALQCAKLDKRLSPFPAIPFRHDRRCDFLHLALGTLLDGNFGTDEEPVQEPFDVSVEEPDVLLEREACDRTGCVGADSGQTFQPFDIGWKLSVVLVDDSPGSSLQVHGAAVVSEA